MHEGFFHDFYRVVPGRARYLFSRMQLARATFSSVASYTLLLTYSYLVHAQIRVGAVDVGVESGSLGDRRR